MTVFLWRIATEAAQYRADDMTGKGAETTGGRWNQKGTPMIYASTSLALAALEVVVHLPRAPAPLNRYIIRIAVPDAMWEGRHSIDQASAPPGWDAEPAGLSSRQFGEDWVKRSDSCLHAVPSIVVPLEQNVLLNPAHPQSHALKAENLGKFTFDARIRP
ncbi:RES domain-containing protein [Bacillus sp. NP157]|nr:RES domain-containing protein [Bacillus sp. NP157]